jgi:hypothetical protein
MSFEDGKIVTQSRPLARREIARLSSAELDKFLATIRKAVFFSNAEKIGDPARIMDGGQSTWMAS